MRWGVSGGTHDVHRRRVVAAMRVARVWIGVLGPLEVWVDGRQVVVAGWVEPNFVVSPAASMAFMDPVCGGPLARRTHRADTP